MKESKEFAFLLLLFEGGELLSYVLMGRNYGEGRFNNNHIQILTLGGKMFGCMWREMTFMIFVGKLREKFPFSLPYTENENVDIFIGMVVKDLINLIQFR